MATLCQVDGYLSRVLIFLACSGFSQVLPPFSTNVQGEIHSCQINVTAIMKTTTQAHEG
jgi:short-subunit dehydrogenase